VNLEALLRIAGVLQIALAAAHLFLSKPLKWPEELSRLSPINRRIFLVHTFFIGLILVLFGALSLFAPETLLVRTDLSDFVLVGLSIFWTIRRVFQWTAYDRSLWRGDRFRTVVHGVATCVWLYLAAAYALTLVGR